MKNRFVTMRDWDNLEPENVDRFLHAILFIEYLLNTRLSLNCDRWTDWPMNREHTVFFNISLVNHSFQTNTTSQSKLFSIQEKSSMTNEFRFSNTSCCWLVGSILQQYHYDKNRPISNTIIIMIRIVLHLTVQIKTFRILDSSK